MTDASGAAGTLVRYRVTGMDCPHCAAKVSRAAREVAGVRDVEVSIATQVMVLRLDDPSATPLVERAVGALGYGIDHIDAGQIDGPAHTTPAYRRALWTVVLLNLGYGVVEIVGGFIAGSQAVKADALDFIGDGLISSLGLMAIHWGLAARASAALAQGVFLGLLGLGVIMATAYRTLVQQAPEPELMGWLGAIALLVNVAAAVVLIPHRKGDANVRAVWLFSRNDAIGNLAVVVAAALVAATDSAWPDLVVAVGVAGLFLHSAAAIIRHARAELAQGARSEALASDAKVDTSRRPAKTTD